MARSNRKTLLTKRLLPAFKRWLNEEYDCNIKDMGKCGEPLKFTVDGTTHVISDNRDKYSSLLVSKETEAMVHKFLRLNMGFSKRNVVWMLFIGDQDDAVPHFLGWWSDKPEASTLLAAIDTAVLGESGATIKRTQSLLNTTRARFGKNVYYFKKVKEGDFTDI